jgi:rare lipoprotein A (peptidoglycan hydrolase)
VCALAGVAVVAPSPAEAGTGGAQYSGGDVTLSTARAGLVGRMKRFTGTGEPGRTVTIERYDELERQWAPIAHATVDTDGTFRTRWKADRAGAARVRARTDASDAVAASAAPEVAITLYRPAKATWYGPGFYGRQTACRKRMSRKLVGVAHRSLPCGTRVTLLYRGRTLTVPVVDRGPFANGAKWDLTYAAAQRLGFEATDTVGALTRADSR